MTENFETFGAHIRNILSPYATLVHILEDITKDGVTEKKKNILIQYLLDENNIKNCRENLEHFKEFSYLDELEELNWRATELADRYYMK